MSHAENRSSSQYCCRLGRPWSLTLSGRRYSAPEVASARAPNLFSTVSAELRGRDDERGRSREKVMGLYACPRSEKRKKNFQKKRASLEKIQKTPPEKVSATS
jgi:hypothetical protein